MRQVSLWMASSDDDPDRAWCVALHRILARMDMFCHTLDPKALTTILPNEEANAKARAKTAFKSQGGNTGPSRRDRPYRPRHEGNRNNNHTNKRRGGGDKHCTHHGPGAHDTSECRVLKRSRPVDTRTSQGTTSTST
jgi:hypothetical protein